MKRMKKFRNFFKNIPNFPRMNFWHPRTITTMSKFGVCMVSHQQSRPCWAHFWPKILKFYQKMHKEWWKNEKKLEIFQKYCNFPQHAFWAFQNHHKLEKLKFLQNFAGNIKTVAKSYCFDMLFPTKPKFRCFSVIS